MYRVDYIGETIIYWYYSKRGQAMLQIISLFCSYVLSLLLVLPFTN